MADAITTKNITSVDEVQSVDNTDKVFVNDNGSFKQISVSNLMKQAPSGVTEETDPTVSEWAKQPTKPSYTADEVGALPVGTKIPTKTSDLTNDSGYLTQIPEEYVTETELGQKGYVIEDDIPEKLPSPGTLTFTGAVNDTYDGSANKTINIPTGGGEGGTSDYNALANKPKLNGVEIAGNKTSTDYKIVSSEQGIENNGKFLGVGVDGNVTPVDKPTYTADEVGARPNTWTPSAKDVGALPNDTEIPSKTSDLENDSGFITNSDIPEKLPNPQKIIFTGAVSAEYDGSSQQTINIPTGGGSDPYTLPIMSDTQLGGGKAIAKTDEDVPVAVDPETGQLFVPTYPENTGGGGGTVDPEQIKQAVNGYLEENPVSGMTAEQEQQLNQNTTDITNLKSALPDKLDTNQGSGNKGKVMIVGDDGSLKPDDVNIADKSVTFNKLGEDIATKISVRPEYELLKSDMTQYSGWIKFDELVNIIVVFSGAVMGNTRVYYTDGESGLDEQNPIYTSYPYYTAKVQSNKLTVVDENVLKAKYVQISFQQTQDTTMSVYGLKKEESGQIELYSKGDSVNPSNKTLEVVGTYNGDTKYIECVPGESYTIEYESLNGRISTGVLINGIFSLNPTIYPPMSNNMVVEVPQSANAIQIEYWNSKSTTVKVTGKFYGDLTRPSQKLVKENFDENILRYIRENIGGNVSGAVFYNCQDYGVIPGSSDNTDAMQSLIDLVHENGGGVIWIPVGTYKFHKDGSTSAMGGNAQNNVYLKSNVSILGESVIGSVFKLYGDTQTGCSMFGFFTSGEDVLEGCTFSNFTVDLSEETMAQYSHKGKAFYVSGIKNCIFRDLRLISTPSTSLGIDMLDNVVMDSIYVYQGGRQWVLGGNGGAGIGIGTGKWKNENYVIRNCVCDSCGHFGIFLEDQGIFSSAKDKNYPKGQIIANNVVRNGRHYALGLRGGKNVIFTGNNTYENVGGMYLDYGAQNVIIANNIFADCTENGLLFGNEDNTVNGMPESIPCDTVFISGNLFKNNKVAIKELTVPISMEKSNNMFIGNTSES